MSSDRGTTDAISALDIALADSVLFLREHGERHVSGRLAATRLRLEGGDLDAIQTALIEATGSMGSFRDLILSARNGHAVSADQELLANARLASLVTRVYDTAREALSAVEAS